MKKTLSILLALILLSILPLNVLASDLTKSKIVDIDMTNIKPRELPCFDGKLVLEGCYSSDDTTTSVYLCTNEDTEEYCFVITDDDVNYETVYLDSISIPSVDLSEYYPANIINGNNSIDYQDGKFHIYLHSWNAEVSYGCLETEDFKTFSFNAEPHIVGRFFNKNINEGEEDYYLYAKTDKGYYINLHYDSEAIIAFTQDLKTTTTVVSVDDIMDTQLVKNNETGKIETEYKPASIEFVPIKNGAVTYDSILDSKYELRSLMAPDKLLYLTYDNELKTIDTSNVDFPEVDLENNIGVISYNIVTVFDEFIYAVESFSATEHKEDYGSWSYIWYEKAVNSVDYYILNEETLKLEKLDISIKDYSEYSEAFATGKVGAIIGTKTDGTYVGTEYFEGKGTEYDIGMNFDSFLYTYIYENSEDLAINEIVLSNYDDEYIYVTVDGFETLYRLPLGENATLIAWTNLYNRIVSTYDEETGIQKYYLLDMSEVYNAISEPNPPTPPVDGIADLNGDKEITIVDAKWTLQAVAESRNLTAQQRAAADVNGDGNVTIVDAKWILQHVAGIRDLTK